MTGKSGDVVSMSGVGGQIFNIVRDNRFGRLTTTTINATDLLACVSGETPTAGDCSGVSHTTTHPIPRFIPFVSMDVEDNEAVGSR